MSLGERMIFALIGRDELSRVFEHAGESADDMERHIARASRSSSRSLGQLSRDSQGRLRDVDGRFVSTGRAAQELGTHVDIGSRHGLPGLHELSRAARQTGDDVDRGSRRGIPGLRRLTGIVTRLGSAATGALPSLGGGAGMMGTLKGLGVVAGVTALPAIGALVPMLAGAATAGVTTKLAFSGVGEAAALAGKDAKGYRKALKGMGPEQRTFTKTLVAGKRAFSGLGKEVQKIVLPHFTRALKEAKPLVGIVKGGVKGMAGVFADLGDQFGKLFGSNRFQNSLRRNLSLGTGFIRQILSPLGTFTQALLDFGAASKPTLDAFGKGIGGLLGKGLPGFFRGLQGGIKGSAEMFRGLFSALNMILPALGELAGAVANAAGPALRELFESAGTNGAGAFRTLAGAVKFLKPLFGEVGAAARIISISLGVIGSIAKNVGRAVLDSLWPSFRQADQAVGPLQKLARWLKTNKGAVQEFTRIASAGIIDFVSAAISAAPTVIHAYRLMVTGVLTAFDGIISGAAHAFGWIPGIGGKLKKANREFDKFKNGFISGLHTAEAKTRAFANRVGPRLAQNKLKMNIRNWESQIATAKRQMKSVPASKRADLRARITDLQRKIRQAKREIGSLHSRTVHVTVRYNVLGRPQAGEGNRSKFARGGLVGFAHGGRLPGFPGGGLLSGAGTSTSDSNLIMASTGEYMIKAAAVRKYGVKVFDELNAMRYPTGARTAAAATGAPRAAAAARGGPAVIQASFHIETLDPLAGARAIRKMLLELKRTHGVNVDLGVA